MGNNVRQFLESLNKSGTFNSVNFTFKHIKGNENIEQYSLEELEQFILNLKPNSPKAIITICYALGLYARWLKEQNLIDNNDFLERVQSIDRNALWKKAKPNVSSKFISYDEYKEVIYEIGLYEDLNSLYYQTLLQCMYEGVYSDDMSVIKNLSLSDIKNDNTLLLKKDDGLTYEFNVTTNLVKNLKELAINSSWERKIRNGICQITIKGIKPDSCFKIERRNIDTDGNYRYSYYARLRKVSKDYFERSIPAFNVFISGIMYRIGCELKKNNITLEDAFSERSRNEIAYSIISNELKRCNYGIKVSNFREIVKGNIDVFTG